MGEGFHTWTLHAVLGGGSPPVVDAAPPAPVVSGPGAAGVVPPADLQAAPSRRPAPCRRGRAAVAFPTAAAPEARRRPRFPCRRPTRLTNPRARLVRRHPHPVFDRPRRPDRTLAHGRRRGRSRGAADRPDLLPRSPARPSRPRPRQGVRPAARPAPRAAPAPRGRAQAAGRSPLRAHPRPARTRLPARVLPPKCHRAARPVPHAFAHPLLHLAGLVRPARP